jgi:urate oxidase
MSIVLAGNSYGKSRVRVVKVSRRAEGHDLVELAVNVQFEGAFDTVHVAGDNSAVLPTDTMKNTVNAMSKAWSGEQIEEFGSQLAQHFLDSNPQVSRVRIEIGQSQWIRMDRHAFTRGSEEKRTTEVVGARGGMEVQSGIENLIVLKTTGRMTLKLHGASSQIIFFACHR